MSNNGRGNGNRRGPPDHVEERSNGAVHVGERADEQRSEGIDALRESVDWSNAPDWARLLHLQIEEIRDQ
jgi:hypothetical protein